MHNTATSFDNNIEIRLWLSRISNDDADALSQLMRLFWNKVYTQALIYLKSSAIAQELAQDIFLKIWMNRSKLPEIDNFSGYLFIITRNEIISLLRKKQIEPEEPGENIAEETWIPDQQLQYKQSYATILNGVELLPPARKNIFKMSRMEGLSYDEIAEQMNISRNGVKDHIVKSLAFLRNYTRFHS